MDKHPDQTIEDMMPAQCIVLDRESPKRPFWLRVRIENGIDIVELEDADGPAMTLPSAVQAAIRLGYDPTHSMDAGSMPFLIPDSVVRRPGSAPRSTRPAS